MISLENAKRLKELGVEGSIASDPYGFIAGEHHLPTLSQLLEEVEKRGYKDLVLARCYWIDGTWAWYFQWSKTNSSYEHGLSGKHDTPEDAVALALIAILGGEK